MRLVQRVFVAVLLLACSSPAEEVQLPQVPPLVQETIRTRLGSPKAAKIQAVSENGIVTYVVTSPIVVTSEGGFQKEIRVDQNGTLLSEKPLLPAIATTAIVNPSISAATNADNLIGGASTNSPAPAALAAPKRIHLYEVPLDARTAFRSLIGSGQINEITRGTASGRTIYQIIFTDRGQNSVLQVDENGNVLYDGRPASASVVASAPQASTSKLKQLVPLSAAQPLRIVDLPSEVETPLKAMAGAAPIDHLIWGIWNGQRVYQSSFKWNGQTATLQFDDFGNVLFDSRNPSSTR
jgi:hypothetical protein